VPRRGLRRRVPTAVACGVLPRRRGPRRRGPLRCGQLGRRPRRRRPRRRRPRRHRPRRRRPRRHRPLGHRWRRHRRCVGLAAERRCWLIASPRVGQPAVDAASLPIAARRRRSQPGRLGGPPSVSPVGAAGRLRWHQRRSVDWLVLPAAAEGCAEEADAAASAGRCGTAAEPVGAAARLQRSRRRSVGLVGVARVVTGGGGRRRGGGSARRRGRRGRATTGSG